MKKKGIIQLLILLAMSILILGCVQEREDGNISPKDAFSILQENQESPDFVLLDVRTPEEYFEEHIEDAVNIDYYAEDFKDQISALDRDKTYLIYCGSGKRGGLALELMNELGFENVFNIEGGLRSCRAEGFEIV